MATERPRILLEVNYFQAAQEYLRRLPREHFLEATPQATQRRITLESLDLVHARRPDIQFFNELLVQYPLPRRKRPGQVVPDNMVVVHPEPIKAVGSYDVPLQPVGPFWMLEYVSKGTSRKDYDDNMRRYERELQVPYYLLFAPEEQEVTLYRMVGKCYVSVPPDEEGRYGLPELEVAVGLLEGWVRFWFRGKRIPLMGELDRQLTEMTGLASEERRARLAAEEEVARLRAQLAQRTTPTRD